MGLYRPYALNWQPLTVTIKVRISRLTDRYFIRDLTL